MKLVLRYYVAVVVFLFSLQFWKTFRYDSAAKQYEFEDVLLETLQFKRSGRVTREINSSWYPYFDNGINFDAFLDFAHEKFDSKNTSATLFPSYSSQKAEHVAFPEVLYVVDSEGQLWRSVQAKNRTQRVFLRGRMYPTEEIVRRAVSQSNLSAWPRLQQAIQQGGFPYFAYYGDFRGCNFQNYNHRHSIPLFTTCASVGCRHTVPAPAYKIVLEAKETAEEWEAQMMQYQHNYSWATKIQKVVWRGSLTGEIQGNVRWHLCSLVTSLPPSQQQLFDLGLTRIPSRHKNAQLNLTAVGGLVTPIYPMESFQQYRVIIDIDGNSWSSRFGKLLCYNSVILKVEPSYVEFFYKDLRPWQHYLPVHADLSNLVEQATYALEKANEDVVMGIIANANAWCRKRMTRNAQVLDFLEVFEAYLLLLDHGDSNWNSKWEQEKSHFLNQTLRLMEKVFQYKGM